MRTVAALCFAAAAAAASGEHFNSTCGIVDPSPVPDCTSADLGTCGNACCAVNVTGIRGANTTDVYNRLVAYLRSGGEDGAYTYVTGPDAHGNDPSDDLTPYNISWDYILQGTHTTYPGRYVDTVDLAIYHGADEADDSNQHDEHHRHGGEGTYALRAFNIAGIHGALGDHGQSYKTIAYMAKAAFGEGVKLTKLFGCGKSE